MISDWLTQTCAIIGGPVSRSVNSTASDFDKVCLAAFSYLNENLPIAYVSEQPQRMLAIDYTEFTYTDTVFLYSDRFAYTNETYNNPQKLWTFVSVSSFIRSSNILLIEVSGKRHFSATCNPRCSLLWTFDS
jgi:hypothetical protein